jgi:hypothetical protein
MEGNLLVYLLPETPYFRKYMKTVEPCWKPICSDTNRAKIIQKKGAAFHFDYRSDQLKYGKPSTISDLWTSKANVAFMGASMHLQTPRRFETKSYGSH